MNCESQKVKGIIFSLLGGFFWGFSGVCGQYLFNFKNTNTEWLTSVRMLFAGIIMVIIALITQRENVKCILSDKRDRIVLVLFGVVGLMTCQYSFFASVAESNAATATILQYLGPALIMIYMCIRALRLPTPREFMAVILAMLGIFVLATHGDIHNLAISPLGLLLGFISAVTLALYTVMPVNIISRWGSVTVTGFGMLIAGVVFTIIVRAWKIPQNIDMPTLIATIAIVIFGTVIPFTLYLQGVSYIGAQKASVLVCIEPVSSTIMSAFWLKNKFTLMDILGFSLIIITVIMLSVGDNKNKNYKFKTEECK